MATIQNDRDVLLQAAPVRYIVATLPIALSVPVAQITGLGALAVQNTVAPGQLQNATVSVSQFVAGLTGVEIVSVLPTVGNFDGRTVVLTTDGKLYRYRVSLGAFTTVVPTTDLTGQITTTQITNSAVTTPLLNAGAVVTSKIAAGAVTATELAANSVTAGAIVAGAIDGFVITGATLRTASSGARVEMSSGTLKATDSGGSNLILVDNTGKASFTGGAYDPGGGSNFAAAAASIGTSTNPTAVVGFYGYNQKTGFGGGQAVKGHSSSVNPNGIGLFGLGETSTSIAILAQNFSGGPALQLQGPMLMSSSALVTNFNADLLDSFSSGDFANILVLDSGTATCGGGGFQVHCTVTGMQFRATGGNAVVLESVSDSRLKTNIESESLGLDFIKKLKPKSYSMLADPTVTYHGLLADDLHALLSNENDALRTTSDLGVKGTDYLSLIGPLILSVQQLSAKVDELLKDKP